MATFNNRLEKLEKRYVNEPLSELSDAELDARIINIMGYLPNREEMRELIRKLKAGEPVYKRINGNKTT